jgi:thiol-disulfide isomerase/thioredoxin
MSAQRRTGHRRGSLATVFGLVVLLAFAGIFWKSIRQRLDEKLILRSETIDDSVFRELFDSSEGKSNFVRKAWNSGKIPHREAVVRLLKENAGLRTPETESILLAGARDGDASVRELSLATLSARNDVSLPALLAEQIRDADPNLRLLAIDYLRGQPTNIALPLLGKTLEDDDLSVAASACVALGKFAGEDFGVRVAQVLGTNLTPGARQEFESKRGDARKWWAAHETIYPSTLQPKLPRLDATFVVADFTLRDLSGKTVRLSNFRGKKVLLNFWTTWCTACQSEFATLNELQRRHTNDLVILGISLDGVADEHGHHTDREETAEKPSSHEQNQKEVARFAAARGLKYLILLDPEDSVGARFNGGELPTNVIIDEQGRFRRRFIGPRTVGVFEAMLDATGMINEKRVQ